MLVLSRIVGEAAFTGKHSWVHSDGQTHCSNLSGQNICEVLLSTVEFVPFISIQLSIALVFCPFTTEDLSFFSQDDSCLHQQFSSGIKVL